MCQERAVVSSTEHLESLDDGLLRPRTRVGMIASKLLITRRPISGAVMDRISRCDDYRAISRQSGKLVKPRKAARRVTACERISPDDFRGGFSGALRGEFDESDEIVE